MRRALLAGLLCLTMPVLAQDAHVGFLQEVIHIRRVERPPQVGTQRRFMRLHLFGKPASLL